MTSPSADTNDPDPPELKRTDDFCTWSYHACGSSNLYFFFRCSLGAALKSQSPSSAAVYLACVMVITSARMGIQRYRCICSPPGVVTEVSGPECNLRKSGFIFTP